MKVTEANRRVQEEACSLRSECLAPTLQRRGVKPASISVFSGTSIYESIDDLDFILIIVTFLRIDTVGGGLLQRRGKPRSERTLVTNFVPMWLRLGCRDLLRGAGSKNRDFWISGSALAPHVSEFPVGTYKKAHRHCQGANVVILTGTAIR